MYIHYQIKDYKTAREYYNRALKCSNITESQIKSIYEKLEKYK